MINRIELVEKVLRSSVNNGTFSSMDLAEQAVKAWLHQRILEKGSVASSLEGDMVEDSDADYQDQAMRSVDA